MNSSYILRPSNFEYIINDHFPKLENGKKLGIFLSGGMESTLISYIAIQLFGKENILFFYSDGIFCSNNPAVKFYIDTNVSQAAATLQIETTYVDFDYEAHIANRKQSIELKIKRLETEYNVQYVMFGFTKLFFEVEVFKQPGMTKEDIFKIVRAQPIEYASTIEEFYLDTDRYTEHLLDIDIPADVYPMLRTSPFLLSPFKDLNKSEVVDFYNQLDILEILYATSSCITGSITRTGKHCGACFNCQQRWDSFKILNQVEDLTEYQSDDVRKFREELERVIHS